MHDNRVGSGGSASWTSAARAGPCARSSRCSAARLAHRAEPAPSARQPRQLGSRRRPARSPAPCSGVAPAEPRRTRGLRRRLALKVFAPPRRTPVCARGACCRLVLPPSRSSASSERRGERRRVGRIVARCVNLARLDVRGTNVERRHRGIRARRACAPRLRSRCSALLDDASRPRKPAGRAPEIDPSMHTLAGVEGIEALAEVPRCAGCASRATPRSPRRRSGAWRRGRPRPARCGGAAGEEALRLLGGSWGRAASTSWGTTSRGPRAGMSTRSRVGSGMAEWSSGRWPTDR